MTDFSLGYSYLLQFSYPEGCNASVSDEVRTQVGKEVAHHVRYFLKVVRRFYRQVIASQLGRTRSQDLP